MLPLCGLRVLDLGRVVAGPFATQLLGDLGAEILKIEMPGSGDESRRYGPSFLEEPDEKSISGFFLAFNRNKKSISMNIATEAGKEVILKLVKHCDVFIENYKFGDLARRGLGYAEISAINPGIVYCSITGFGQSGPYAAYPAVDVVFQAMSGLMSVTGEPDGPPQKVGIAIADIICGLYAANAIQAALRAREINGGAGQYIDLALMDCAVAAMSYRAMDYFLTARAPMRSGNAAPGASPAQLFTCRDGLLNVQAYSDDQFRKLCEVVNRADLLADPRFSQALVRHRNRAKLVPVLEALFANDTVANWYARLIAAGVICSPVYDLADTFRDPQVLARGSRTIMASASGRQAPTIRNPMRLSKTPIDQYVFPPELGQHTEAVLRCLLGLSDEEISQLRSDGAI